MVCSVKGKVMNIEPDKYKADIFRLVIYQDGASSLIRIGGVPKADVGKFQQGGEIVVKCDVFIYRPKDSNDAFLVTRYISKA